MSPPVTLQALQYAQLVNIMGYPNEYQFNADASQGWSGRMAELRLTSITSRQSL